MTAREGIWKFLQLIQSSKLVVASEDWDKVFEIASTCSRSAGFDQAREYYIWKHEVSGSLAFGKGVRWFVILREEEGQAAFEKAFAELRQLAKGKTSPQSLPATPRKGQWQLRSGEQVFDREDSHIHAGVQGLLEPALGYVNSEGRNLIVEEVNFRVNIGQTICVETQTGDEIIFAQRVGRKGLSRFVKNHVPQDTQWVTVVLKRLSDGSYELRTAFLGRKAEPEPWDQSVTAESLKFWSKHALCWGYEEIIPGTETTVCPWPLQ